MVGVEELLLVLTAPGDGVIINPPVYPPYFADIPHVGRRLVEVPLLADVSLDVEGIDRAFAAGARALLLCNPHNPTGRVPHARELAAIAAAADAHGAWVIADEIHAPLTFAGEFIALGRRVGARRGVTSASKAFNLAGLKLGDRRRASADRLHEGAATDHAGLSRARSRPRRRSATATSGSTRRSRRSPPTTRGCRRCCRRACAWRCRRRRASSRGSTAARRGWATIRRRCSWSAGGSRCSAGLGFGAQGAGFARLNVGTTPELVEEASGAWRRR